MYSSMLLATIVMLASSHHARTIPACGMHDGSAWPSDAFAKLQSQKLERSLTNHYMHLCAASSFLRLAKALQVEGVHSGPCALEALGDAHKRIGFLVQRVLVRN